MSGSRVQSDLRSLVIQTTADQPLVAGRKSQPSDRLVEIIHLARALRIPIEQVMRANLDGIDLITRAFPREQLSLFRPGKHHSYRQNTGRTGVCLLFGPGGILKI